MSAAQLDAHERPPDKTRLFFKNYQNLSVEVLDQEATVITPASVDLGKDQALSLRRCPPLVSLSTRTAVFERFLARPPQASLQSTPVFEHSDMPGLFIFPNLLPIEIQICLLDRVFHRDLSTSHNLTNVHLHHHVLYPISVGESKCSFFDEDQARILPPKDPVVHKDISICQFLSKKLRWMTLGGQYDWTAKRYPSVDPPPFPDDIKNLLKGLFPDVDPQAAIVNVYSPGDTLSVHRDVSEECGRGLISTSIGCDGLFVVGSPDGEKNTAIRLRSGDVLLMTGPSRYAWHGVPKIIPNTCPEQLSSWPSGEDSTKFKEWKGWMGARRININVRQMGEVP